ncbi:MAG: acetate--CoA ligase family protein [Pseudomonadota bacterium]
MITLPASPLEELPVERDPAKKFSSLSALFEPKSVAVIGASDDPSRIGGRPLQYLKRAGFAGAVYPVNPNRSTVQGLAAYPDVAAIPFPVDVAIIALPAEQVVTAIEACARKGVKAAIIFSAGFAETGPEGAARQAAIASLGRQSGMRVLGPNCLGAFNSGLGFFGTFSQAFDKDTPEPGPIAIASQSGACGSHLVYLFRQRNVGLNYWITTGNETDVDVAECMLWLAQSPKVKVIVAYAEAIRDGATFIHALETARRNGKAVVMIKVGRSNAGGLAAASHTGALVGRDDVYDAVMRQYGVYRADSIQQLVDTACACAHGIFPADRSLGIITLSGGLGIQAADAAERYQLDVRPLNPAGQAQIKALISFAGTANPIDVTAQVVNDPELTGKCIDVALSEGGYQSLICLFSSVPAVTRLGDPILQALIRLRVRFPERLIVLSLAAPIEVVRRYEAAGFLVFEDCDCAIAAISALAGFAESFAAAAGDGAVSAPPSADKPLPDRRLPAVLDEHAAKALLAAAGIPVLPEKIVHDGPGARQAAAEMGCPVVLKIVSPDITHKTEVGGVILNVQTPLDAELEATALLDRIAKLVPGARLTGVLVSPMCKAGIETICGIFTDPVFGPVVMFGLGGIHVEVLRDVAFRLAPFDESEARSMISEIRGYRLLEGVRGAPPADIDVLARALVRLSDFALAYRGLVNEVDINPFVVLPRGQGAYALDALIVGPGAPASFSQ